MTGGWYKFLLVCHILAAIFGFGAVVLNGIYGAESKKRQGAEGLAITEANHRVSNVGEYFIYAVPIFGILMVLASHHVWKFSQTWVWLALLLWFAFVGLVHGVHRPNLRRLDELVRSGGAEVAEVAEMERRERLASTMGAVMSVLVLAALVLMVFKPGAPGS